MFFAVYHQSNLVKGEALGTMHCTLRHALKDFFLTYLLIHSEKAMAPHSSTLAWRIPGTGEHGGLPSMGLHRVGHD